MYAITFYSFKGGVGRTTALVHIAWLMKDAGKKVLVCDMDLDAPGFFHHPFAKEMKLERGIVDFFTDYLRTADIPDVQHYIETSPEGFDVLPAGGRGDSTYPEKLAAIDWNELNEKYYGDIVIQKLREQFREAGYDYVLIDSKTGFSDVGGLCTLQLPDAVVLISGLNDQNLKGMAGVHGLIQQYNKDNPTRRVEPVPV
ncbi:AAA family ATPase, partial [bacterium]|nr:AAA family ATPase [bacterium]